MRPHHLLLALVLSALAPSATAQESAPSAWTPLEGTTPAQWRVVWTENPAFEATLSWSTALEGSSHRVRLGTTPEEARSEEAWLVDCQRNGPYSGAEGTGWYHHARLELLDPSTTYWFQLESDGVRSPLMHFVTAPEDDRPFKLIYGGDSRSGIQARQEMNLLMASLTEEHPEVIAFAHGGDYIYDGRVWPQWKTWLSQQELCTTSAGRVLPIVPVRGNHDVGPLYDEIFDEPGGALRNYYVAQLSPEVALVTLNTEISTAGDQAAWLEDRLEELRGANRWLLAQYHRPAWPAVKTPGAARASWVPLFEEHDVDLVLESDGHVVKRTVPIRDGKHDPTGVTYIGEGGLGVPQRTPDAERWYLQPPGMTTSGHHVTLLDIGTEGLSMRTVGPALPQSRFQPRGHATLVPDDATWRYLAGEDPPADWTREDFDDTAWPLEKAGFGYGDEDDATVLEDMPGTYTRVYLRLELPAAALHGRDELALLIRFDDGFIAYFEGHEVLRAEVASGRGAQATGIGNHEARGFEYFPLEDWSSLVEGEVVTIAIEGHNNQPSSSDFSLQPSLIADPTNLADREQTGLREIDAHRLLPRARN